MVISLLYFLPSLFFLYFIPHLVFPLPINPDIFFPFHTFLQDLCFSLTFLFLFILWMSSLVFWQYIFVLHVAAFLFFLYCLFFKHLLSFIVFALADFIVLSVVRVPSHLVFHWSSDQRPVFGSGLVLSPDARMHSFGSNSRCWTRFNCLCGHPGLLNIQF